MVVPIRGTASDVDGIFSATRFRKTVNDNKIVTPVDRPMWISEMFLYLPYSGLLRILLRMKCPLYPVLSVPFCEDTVTPNRVGR